MQLVWHYTMMAIPPNEDVVNRIFAHDRALLAKRDAVGNGRAVWFSTNQTYDGAAAARSDRRFTARQLVDDGYGLLRIGVESTVAALTWGEFIRAVGISKNVAKRIGQHAALLGSSPNEWRFARRDVPAGEWVRVERFDGVEWKDVTVG